MPSIARLYRIPVKGLTPEPVDHLDVRASGAVEGDRVLGFLFASAGDEQRPGWWGKDAFLTMQNTPGLARVDCRFDPATKRLALALDGNELASGSVADDAGRARLTAALEAAVATFEVNPLSERPERSPLQLVGDGAEPRFHDRTSIHVTLVNAASMEALAANVGSPVDERRFRMNVTIEGLEPWAEHDWIGQSIRIGDAEFDVTGPVVRCLATHANPVTGERDIEVMQTLTREFGHERPTMGVLAVPRAASTLRVGDEVALL
jgi:uncharacterized protein YcbX